MAEKKRLPKDFNQMKPDDVEITDPERAAREAAGIPVDREYPKHLHKFVAPGQPHDYVEVADAKAEASKRREGWMSPQEAAAEGANVTDAPAVDAPAKAPRAKKAAKTPTAKKKAAKTQAAKQ